MFTLTFGGMNMFVRGDADANHAEERLGHHSSVFHAWSGPARHSKKEKVRAVLEAARGTAGCHTLCLSIHSCAFITYGQRSEMEGYKEV